MLGVGTAWWSFVLLLRGHHNVVSVVVPALSFAFVMALPLGVALAAVIVPGLMTVRAFFGGGRLVLALAGALLMPVAALVMLIVGRALLAWPGSLTTDLDAVMRDPFFVSPLLLALLTGGVVLGLIISRTASARRRA